MRVWGEAALQTMQEAYKRISEEHEDPWVALGDFSNDFFDQPERRADLVCDPVQEPASSTGEQHRWAVFCAASVEYLCQKYGIACPDWTSNPAYALLPEPWFDTTSTKPQVLERLRETTPDAFRRRNIYCGDRIYINKREAAAEFRRKLELRLKRTA